MPFVASTSVVLFKTVAGDSVSQSLYHLVFYSFILLDSGVLSYSTSLCSHRIDNRKLSPWLSSDWHKLSIFRPFKFDLDLYSSYHIMRGVCCLGDLQGNLVS